MSDSLKTVKKISSELSALGIRKKGVLLVHSSFGSVKAEVSNPELLIMAFLDALGPEGTLLMPALSYEIVTDNNPEFHIDKTPSNVGYLTEYFRTRPGTLRSMHPTHSLCATGDKAHEILTDHRLDITPVGKNSPFRKLTELKGQILMLGCGLRPSTSMHGVEELVIPPYLFGGELYYRLIDGTGNIKSRLYKKHGFKGWIQRYDRLENILISPELKKGAIAGADTWLIESKVLWEKGREALQQNPLFFVDKAG
ncbi:MAG: AAC(3) family N-acetyltransferase [Bacteroidales bacterium]